MNEMNEHLDSYHYSRAELREWLEGLPPDEPYPGGVADKCPIAARFGCSNDDAAYLDQEFTGKVDTHEKQWAELTPRDLLTILDELESEYYRSWVPARED